MATISTNAVNTGSLYGRRYVSSRHSSARSYVWSTGSSSAGVVIGPRASSRLLHLLLQELPAVQLRVVAAARHQLVVPALLHHAALLQDHDQVRVLHGRHAVADQERRARAAHLAQAAQHLLLRVGVDRGHR